MEEHAKTEQQASKEQQQVMTGRCGEGTADLAGTALHRLRAGHHLSLSTYATQLVQQSQTDADRQRWQAVAVYHLTLAGVHSQEAQTLLDGRDALWHFPGHRGDPDKPPCFEHRDVRAGT